MKFLIRNKRKKNKNRKITAHIWSINNNDTVCRMASTGGLDTKNYRLSDENHNFRICQLCTNKMVKLLKVNAPDFDADAVWRYENGWCCVEAAPVIKWMIGKRPAYVKMFLDKKQWSYEWVHLT